ncbi:hypothetical protein CHISP_1276 [Chitinispirillum alkaliphilum]|nr:hypothetical protein CHISP_1276 [Chitinispirillum alkaliphilum]
MKIFLIVPLILIGVFLTEAHETANTDETQAESIYVDSLQNIGEIPDSLEQDRISIVRREYDHKRQVWLAVGMMAFLALIISSAQSWNPR